jgi:hypothetical protein
MELYVVADGHRSVPQPKSVFVSEDRRKGEGCASPFYEVPWISPQLGATLTSDRRNEIMLPCGLMDHDFSPKRPGVDTQNTRHGRKRGERAGLVSFTKRPYFPRKLPRPRNMRTDERYALAAENAVARLAEPSQGIVKEAVHTSKRGPTFPKDKGLCSYHMLKILKTFYFGEP